MRLSAFKTSRSTACSVAVVRGLSTADGITLKGYAVDGVDADDQIEVTGVSAFGRLVIGNLDGVTVNSDGADTDLTSDGRQVILRFGSNRDRQSPRPKTFKIRHDESAGVNNTPDPNDADDTAAAPAIITEAGALGYAKSSVSALTLFNNPSVGADEDATFAFAITDADGDPLVNVASGLFTLGGIQILLSTDADGVLVGSADLTEIFKVYVGPDGVVWIAQYKPIAHDVDGASAAAFDDIATIAADLRVKATITDNDGDSITAVSDVALSIEFQDDGPTALDDGNAVTARTVAPMTGNVSRQRPARQRPAWRGHADRASSSWNGSGRSSTAPSR